MGVAAGLSVQGKIPYAHTFGPFATRRCFDQVFMSGAYAKANVRIIGSDPGVTAAFNGGTHMPLEDLGIMRNIPEMTIVEPVDNAMLADIIRQLATQYGMFYIRLFMLKKRRMVSQLRPRYNIRMLTLSRFTLLRIRLTPLTVVRI